MLQTVKHTNRSPEFGAPQRRKFEPPVRDLRRVERHPRRGEYRTCRRGEPVRPDTTIIPGENLGYYTGFLSGRPPPLYVQEQRVLAPTESWIEIDKAVYRPFSPRGEPFLRMAEDVGRNGSNRPGDLLRIQNAFTTLGLLDAADPAVYRDPHHPSFLQAIRLLQREAGETETGALAPDSAAARRLEDKLAANDMASSGQHEPPPPVSGSRYNNAWEARGWGGPRGDYTVPELKTEAERRASILNDTPGRIVVAPNPGAALPWWQQQYDTPDPFWEDERRGQLVVREHERTVDEESGRAGVDPDLVKAVIFTENARGHRYGVEDVMTAIRRAAVENGLDGLRDSRLAAQSVMPMNIQPKLWGDFGIHGMDAFDAPKNIRAGTILIKRISDRLEGNSPQAVYTLYNNLGADKTSEIGEYFGKVYRDRSWNDTLPWYLRRKLGK